MLFAQKSYDEAPNYSARLGTHLPAIAHDAMKNPDPPKARPEDEERDQ
jgi:hypothetical protein